MGGGKKKVSAFIIFVNEKKDLIPEWRNKSTPELVQLCKPLWEQLSPDERQVYEGRKRRQDAFGGHESAQQQQRKKGEVRSGGYDAHGRALEDIKKRDEEAKQAQIEKGETIRKMVTKAMAGKKLEKKDFFMIEVNTFCEDVPALAEENLEPHQQTKKDTVPAEISISKYSIENGVGEIKHYFIKPGKFSRGFSFIVKDNIQKTHKIDSDQENDFYLDYRPDVSKEVTAAELHYESVVTDMLKFMDPSMEDDGNLGLGSRVKLIMFTMPGSVQRCEMSLLWMYRKLFGDVDISELPVRILELPSLFHELAFASVSEKLGQAATHDEKKLIMNKVITATVAEHFLEKDTFKFADGMSCDWHRANDEAMDGCGGSDFCTSTAVRRWGYIISDHLCQKFGIELVKGRHIPEVSDASPPDGWADQEWETLPGLLIRPEVASRGRSDNTDIRYRNEDGMSEIQMGIRNADRGLHSGNTISDFLDDGSSASGMTEFGDAKSVDGKETQRSAAGKERVFGHKNALINGLLGKNENLHSAAER